MRGIADERLIASAFLFTPLVLAGDGDKDALGWRVLGGVERAGVETETSGVPERILLSLSSFLRRAGPACLLR